MNKSDAIELLNLEPAAEAAQINARYKQVAAFFNCDQDNCHELAGKAKLLFDNAYAVLPQANIQEGADNKPVSTTINQSDITDKIKSIVFPHPTNTAGKPLSDQWWRVYTRPVLILLGITALVLYAAPQIFHEPPHYEPSPYREPPPGNSGSPFGEVGPPPGQSSSTNGSTTISDAPTALQPAQTQTIDPGLNPQPNTNPLIIAPSQSPTSFLVGLFSALKDGGNVQSMLKQPPNASVSQMLATSHTACPRWDQVPNDAFSILNQTNGAATVRVNEKYFNGVESTNNYFLVSDNGVWKLSDIQAANEVLP